MSLDSAITYLNDLLEAIAGINSAPENPTESVSAFPAVMVYPANGSFVGEPGLVFRGRHVLNAEVHFNRSNLPAAYAALRPMIKSIADKLRNDPTLGATVDTIISTEGQPVTYRVFALEYANVQAIVLQFQMTVKVHELTVANQVYTPTDTIGLHLALDYRVGVVSSGGLVSEWQDQSGNGNHFTQSTTANKPTLAADGVSFDGIDDALTLGNLLAAGGNSARTVFIKARLDGLTGVEAIFALNNTSAGTGNGRVWCVTEEIAVRCIKTISFDDGLDTASFETITVRNDTGDAINNIEAWLEGVALGVSAADVDTLNIQGTSSALGQAAATGGNGEITIQTIWFYDVFKDDTARAAIELEMMAL